MDENKLKPPSPWVPITDLVDLKHLGKLDEEVAELGAAVSRCVIQGLRNGEAEPVTGKPNKEWLEDEIADVLANINLVQRRFDLNASRIRQRSMKKELHLQEWHSLAHMQSEGYTEDNCPGHVASAHNSKYCGRCGIHVESLR